MRSIVALLLLAGLLSGLAGCSAAKTLAADVKAERPNIVIILADDLGFGDVGVNGATAIKTPHIDKLAKQGIVFDQAYASANVCTPSRAGLLTGRYPIRTSLGHDVIGADDIRALPSREETLAELTQNVGYTTALIGKWHLGRLPEHSPLDHGFDVFFGVPHSNDMPNFHIYDGRERIETRIDQSTLTRRYTERARRFIGENAGGPFFLLFSHTMPHIPLYAGEGYRGRSKAGLYGDVVEELDASVGAIVAELKAHGVLERTLLIVTSDNGPFFEGSSGGLRGGKGATWEGAFRVPFILSWPEVVETGRRAEAMTMNFDVFATAAEAVGAEPEGAELDGRSLGPILRGEASQVHDELFFFNNEDIVAARTAEWKFVTHSYYRRSLGAFQEFDQLSGFEAGYDLLFSTSRNEGEVYSLADRYPKVLADLKSRLRAARERFDEYRTRSADQTFPPTTQKDGRQEQ